MAETKVVNLEVKTNVEPLKKQLREAQKEVEALAAKFGATSDEAVKAAKKAAELKDAIGDAKALTDAFNPDAKFNALSGSLSGVASGFSAVQGAMGLIGVDSKNVEATLLKVQSAMALSQGLQGLGEARDTFKQLGAVASNALKGIKTGLAATGIGLFVVALGAIYTYWDDIKAAVSGVSEEQKKLTAQVHKDTILQQDKLDKLDSQNNILKLQGKSERDILKLKIAQTNEVIKKSEIELENSIQTYKAQVISERKNKEILKGAIDFIAKPLLLILGTVDKIGSFLGKKWTLAEDLKDWSANLIFDPKEVKDEGLAVQKEMRDNLNKLKNDRAGYLLQIKDLDKQEVTSNKTKLDKINTDNEDAFKKKRALDEADFEKRKTDRIAQQAQDAQDLADAKKFDEDKHKSEVEALQKSADARKAANEKIVADNKQRIEKEIADERALTQSKLSMASDALSILSDAVSLFGTKNEKDARNQFKINKALSLSLAIVNTARAVTAALATTNPLPGGRFIEAGIAAASGAVSIAKISATQFTASGGSSGGGGGSTPSGGGGGNNAQIQAPSFNIVGNNGLNQLSQLKQAPISICS
jgi:hypothetical protein